MSLPIKIQDGYTGLISAAGLTFSQETVFNIIIFILTAIYLVIRVMTEWAKYRRECRTGLRPDKEATNLKKISDD